MASTTEERKIKILLDGKQVNASLKEMQGSAAVMNNQLAKMSANDPNRKKLLQDFKTMQDRIKATKTEIYGVQKASAGMGIGFKSAFAALAPLFAIQKVFAFLDDSTQKFNTQAQAVAQLDATLKSTGNSAGFTSKELQDMASSLQGKTLFGDEATIQAQALLLTFTDVKKGVYEDALPAIQDMATKMAGDGPADLKGATIQVGKALNDPIKGISALSKVGVTFTAEQKNTIKTLQEMGDKAGAQKLILAELNKEFGGSAEAARKAGTGGWTAFMNTVGDVQELVGEKLAAGLNRAGNFLSLLVEKSDPVVAIFKEFWNIGGELFDQIMGIAESLGLVSSDAETAGTAVEILAGIFTILLYPLKLGAQLTKALIDGFISIYNRSEMLRGTIGGLGAAFVQLARNLKENVMNAFGGLADLLVGIFTLDADKIKSGLKKGLSAMEPAGRGMADAFAKGYESNKDKLITVTKKTAEEAGEAAVEATKETNKKQKELTEKQLADIRKAHAEHQRELKKAQEEFNKAERNYELELAKLKIEMMQEGIDKVLAKLRFQHDQEMKELEKHKADVLANAAATQAQKAALVANLEEQARLRSQKLEQAERKAKEDAAKEDLEAWFTRFQEEEEIKTERIEQQFFNVFDAELAKQKALLALKIEYAKKALDLLIASGQSETAEAEKLKTKLLGLAKEQADNEEQITKEKVEKEVQYESAAEERKAKNKEKWLKIKAVLEKEALRLAADFIDFGIELLSRDEKARKKNADLIKAFSMGKIIIDLETEIAGYMASPASIASMGIVGSIKSVLASVRAGIALERIRAQPFAEGGATVNNIGTFAAGGPVNSARLGLIGEAGAEWVMPNWMLTSPKYAATAAWLENERRGGGTRAFADGGPTAVMAGSAQQQSNQGLDMLVAEVRVLGLKFDKVERWANSLKVDYHAGNAEEVMQIRQETKNRGTW